MKQRVIVRFDACFEHCVFCKRFLDKLHPRSAMLICHVDYLAGERLPVMLDAESRKSAEWPFCLEV